MVQLKFEDIIEEFQLHHTGIKTTVLSFSISFSFLFQLHHTGIKTALEL